MALHDLRDRTICAVRGHRLHDMEWGYGFGQLELFCRRCGRCVVTVAIGRLAPLADAAVLEVATEALRDISRRLDEVNNREHRVAFRWQRDIQALVATALQGIEAEALRGKETPVS